MAEINCYLYHIMLRYNGINNNSQASLLNLDGLFYFIENNYVTDEFRSDIFQLIIKEKRSLSLYDLIKIHSFLKSDDKKLNDNIKSLDLTEVFNLFTAKCANLKKISSSDLLKIIRNFITIDENNQMKVSLASKEFMFVIILRIFPITDIKPRQITIDESIFILKFLYKFEEVFLKNNNNPNINIDTMKGNINIVRAKLIVQIENNRKKDGVTRFFERLEYTYSILKNIFDNVTYFNGENFFDRLHNLILYTQKQDIYLNLYLYIGKLYLSGHKKYHDSLCDYYLNILKTQPLFLKHTINDLFIICELIEYQHNGELLYFTNLIFEKIRSKEMNQLILLTDNEKEKLETYLRL